MFLTVSVDLYPLLDAQGGYAWRGYYHTKPVRSVHTCDFRFARRLRGLSAVG